MYVYSNDQITSSPFLNIWAVLNSSILAHESNGRPSKWETQSNVRTVAIRATQPSFPFPHHLHISLLYLLIPNPFFFLLAALHAHLGTHSLLPEARRHHQLLVWPWKKWVAWNSSQNCFLGVEVCPILMREERRVFLFLLNNNGKLNAVIDSLFLYLSCTGHNILVLSFRRAPVRMIRSSFLNLDSAKIDSLIFPDLVHFWRSSNLSHCLGLFAFILFILFEFFSQSPHSVKNRSRIHCSNWYQFG